MGKWLQYKLEHYSLPLKLREKNPKLPKEIRTVFKDTSELAGGVLANEINDALENSKYGIGAQNIQDKQKYYWE